MFIKIQHLQMSLKFCKTLEEVKMLARKCIYDATALCYICVTFIKLRYIKFY